jgi:cyclase
MQTKRIIPCLDVDKGRVVKGKKFKEIKEVADPVELAKRYNEEGADELVFYDITASTEGRNLFSDVVERVAKEITIPFTVGGGIRTVGDINRVLQAGADKVSINSAAVTNPDLIKEAASEFGSACIVFALDAKKMTDGKWHVFTKGGQHDTGINAIEWAKRGEELGAGEIVVNSIDADGAKNGYDLELTNKIAEAVRIPVVASGGAGEKEHFAEALKGGAAAALAASVFHYNEIPIPELKRFLAEQDIPIRGQ